ncbi:MAG: hypothetical protein ACUVRD_04760 [Bacteroidia bacterium]
MYKHIGWLIFLFYACDSSPKPNLRLRFDYQGICSECPLSRMDSVLRIHFSEGVIAMAYDSVGGQVVLALDTTKGATIDKIIEVLVQWGYDVNENFSDELSSIVSPCCHREEAVSAGETGGATDSGGGGDLFAQSVPIEGDINLLEAQIEEEIAPSGETVVLEGIEPLDDIDAELSLEDIGTEGELEDVGDIDLDLDLDMDLDFEEKPARKPSKPAP